MTKNEIDVNDIYINITHCKWGTPKSEITYIERDKIMFNGIDDVPIDEKS